MRTTLALAGLVAGLAALAPLAPASAQCDPQVFDTGGSGCANGCMDNGRWYEEQRATLADKGIRGLPSYDSIFLCTQ
ncbi:MAG: hypothetical protein QOE45_2700 [Frankiaceae bacterium]|jgi:hypothetical protein|nr:hypothetical protein [Frankiaceae bacterium]